MILLVDGDHLLHRTLHVKENAELRLRASYNDSIKVVMGPLSEAMRGIGVTGGYTGGAYTFFRALRATLERFPDTRKCVVVFDGGHSARRQALWPDYKAHRYAPKADPEAQKKADEEKARFRAQKTLLRQALPWFGVRVVFIEGYEGDDIIATVARKMPTQPAVIVSEDKDFFQLVDERVTVWRPGKEVHVTLDTFHEVTKTKAEKDGWPNPDLYLLWACVRGDASDNIPGLKGAGQKAFRTAVEGSGARGVQDLDLLIAYAATHRLKRVQALADRSTWVRNLAMIDLGREELPGDALAAIRTAVTTPIRAQPKQARDCLRVLEFESIVKVWSTWNQPFRRLK